jgi:hypothetical protein
MKNPKPKIKIPKVEKPPRPFVAHRPADTVEVVEATNNCVVGAAAASGGSVNMDGK